MPQDRLRSPRGSRGRRLTSLSDFEFRVWDQYQLSADDFGVMRCSPLTVQAENDNLADRPAADVQAALDRLVKVELVAPFDHQGRRYICQLDWQDFQKVEYPRKTIMPAPPAEVIERCKPSTAKLFKQYPGGQTKRKKKGRNSSGTLPESYPERLPEPSPDHSQNIVRAFPPPRETANANANANTNGKRQTAEEPEHPVAKFMRVIYPAAYSKARNGAAIRLNEARDFEVCLQLIDTYGDRLPLMLEYFLNLAPAKDVLNQPGTPRQLQHMAPQVDAELRRHGR